MIAKTHSNPPSSVESIKPPVFRRESSSTVATSGLEQSCSSIEDEPADDACPISQGNSDPSQNRRRSSVQFGSLTVRTYDIVLDDNPSCTQGPALALGWRYNESNDMTIEQYDDWAQTHRRSKNEFHLPTARREDILRDFGYSRRQIDEVSAEISKARKQRRASCNNVSFFSKAQEKVFASRIKMIMKRRKTIC